MDLYSRASCTCLGDQNFAMCISPQDVILPFYNLQCKNYYRPWKCAENFKELGSIIKIEKECFKIILDVQQFQPDEIIVKVNDHEITIEGKHEERQDEFGYVERQFVRRYFLPNNYSSENINASLSSDGVLVITTNTKFINDHEERTVQVKLCEGSLKEGHKDTLTVSETTKDNENGRQSELEEVNKNKYNILSNENQCCFIKSDQNEEIPMYAEDSKKVSEKISEYSNTAKEFRKVKLTNVSEIPEETLNKNNINIEVTEKLTSSSQMVNYTDVKSKEKRMEENVDILSLNETTKNDYENCVNNVASADYSETISIRGILEKPEQSTLKSSEKDNNKTELYETEESQEIFSLLTSETTNKKDENANEVNTKPEKSAIIIDNLKGSLSESTSETVELIGVSKEMDVITSKLQNYESETKETREFPSNIKKEADGSISDFVSATFKEADDAIANVEKSLFNKISTVREKFNESLNLPEIKTKGNKSEIESHELSCDKYDSMLSSTKEICDDVTNFINDALKEVTNTANITEKPLCSDIKQKDELDGSNLGISETVIYESNISEVNNTQEMSSSFDSTTVKDTWDYVNDVASAGFKETDTITESGKLSKEISKITKFEGFNESSAISEEARTEINDCAILSPTSSNMESSHDFAINVSHNELTEISESIEKQ